MSIHDELTGLVIGCAMRVHRELGPGFLESVYQNALCVELTQEGIAHSTEESISVYYRKTKVGNFCADVLVEKRLILELKSVEKINPVHETQLVNYLNATGIDIGLLINFGAASLDFRRKYRKSRPAISVDQPSC
ncbi:GxxExxY protein [soil metagenome]